MLLILIFKTRKPTLIPWTHFKINYLYSKIISGCYFIGRNFGYNIGQANHLPSNTDRSAIIEFHNKFLLFLITDQLQTIHL